MPRQTPNNSPKVLSIPAKMDFWTIEENKGVNIENTNKAMEKLIAKLAKRLMPKVKKAELERLASFRQQQNQKDKQ